MDARDAPELDEEEELLWWDNFPFPDPEYIPFPDPHLWDPEEEVFV